MSFSILPKAVTFCILIQRDSLLWFATPPHHISKYDGRQVLLKRLQIPYLSLENNKVFLQADNDYATSVLTPFPHIDT